MTKWKAGDAVKQYRYHCYWLRTDSKSDLRQQYLFRQLVSLTRRIKFTGRTGGGLVMYLDLLPLKHSSYVIPAILDGWVKIFGKIFGIYLIFLEIFSFYLIKI